MARFTYSGSANATSQPMPRLNMVLSHGSRSITVDGLVDTGSAINVLPYDYGLALGIEWESQRITLTLTGALADYEARAIFVSATNPQLTGSSPVQLAVAWTQRKDAPVIFGQANFLMEFNACFYRSQNYFEVWRA